MTVVVAVIAFVAGVALGAGLAVWLLHRRPLARPALDSAGTRGPLAEPAATPAEPADPDLKPILDATRGVLNDLEERYRGRRAGKSDG
jgi:hypothetical protein